MDLLRVRRRGDLLKLDLLRGDDRERAFEMAEDILGVLRGAEGATEEEVREQLSGIPHDSKEDKVLSGLVKVALDECDFGPSVDVDPAEVRRAVFSAASRVRASLGDNESLDRAHVLADVAKELEQPVEVVEAALFADLKGAAELRRSPTWTREQLLEGYDLASLQGIFLTSTELRIELTRANGAAVRALFRELKFRELLFSVEALSEGGHRIKVSGPMSVFGPRTRYGLRLAQLIPAVVRMGGAKLSADLTWGRDKKSLRFDWADETNCPTDSQSAGLPTMPPPLEQVAASPALAGSGWSIEPAERIFAVPGLGACVPDVVCKKAGRRDVYLELLGYWSREAVFRRVDFAVQLPGERFIFLVPARLRVSEEIVPEGLHACLHIFKTSVVGRRLVEQLEELSS